MLPLLCTVAAVISFQLSTNNSQGAQDTGWGQLYVHPSLHALIARGAFLNTSPAFASVGLCNQASWLHLPGCVSSLRSLAIATVQGCNAIARI